MNLKKKIGKWEGVLLETVFCL